MTTFQAPLLPRAAAGLERRRRDRGDRRRVRLYSRLLRDVRERGVGGAA